MRRVFKHVRSFIYPNRLNPVDNSVNRQRETFKLLL